MNAIAAAKPTRAVRLPIYHFDELWHRGHLDPAGTPREPSSYEGFMLSCSPSDEADEAWLSIARLGGQRQWMLRKATGFTVIDFHRLTRATRSKLMLEAAAAGYVVPTFAFRASYWDEEAQDRRYSLYGSRAEARTEVCEMPAARVRRVRCYAATPKLIASWQRRHGGPAVSLLDVEEAAIACLIEATHPEIDGIWWDDILDEAGLSAPRVGIYPRVLLLTEKQLLGEPNH